MPDISQLVSSLGGVAHVTTLRSRGAGDAALARAVAEGSVRRIRRGWYATLPSADARCIAVSLGGRVTGAAALRLQGAWMWNEPPVEVLLGRGSPTPASRPGVVIHHGREPLGTHPVVPVSAALAHAVPRAAFEEAVALLDWGWKTGQYDRFDFEALLSQLPRRCQRIAEWVDDRAGSFLESVVRTRLRLEGHSVRSQQPVGLLGAIDLVVEGVLAVEVDGREHHAHAFEADREKDAAIVLEGRSTLRLTYGMIRHRWPRVAEVVARAVGDHRGSRARRPARRIAILREGVAAVPWRLPSVRAEPTRGMRRPTGALASP